MLARYLSQIIHDYLQALPSSDGRRLSKQIELCNSLLEFLATECQVADIHDDLLPAEAQRLLAVRPKVGVEYKPLERPDTPISTAALLTNSASDPTLHSQIVKEIASADSVNILCSFIKWSGVRLLKEALESFCHRPGTRLRILTTCYCGATDAKAVQWLASLPNTEVRISYETKRTRLHAKAFQFVRESAFGSGYIGSANISQAALTDGLEWTLKIAESEQRYLWEKMSGTFEYHWNSPDFESFSEEDLLRFEAAIRQERLGGSENQDVQIALFDLEPYTFQKEILERLQAEREFLNRQWQLVVAATGTGKTMIAAFDFREFKRQWNVTAEGRNPRFLFVAHRKEILQQARQKFIGVLRDANFGELLVDGEEPQHWESVFASIQTWTARSLENRLEPDYFDYIVVDEFHHAAAESYQGLLSHVKPRCLLGLTATPERHDSLDVFHFFEGHITAQIRLPDAINRQLLSPFHYFCVTDSVDLTSVKWERGRYVVRELESEYVNNDERTQMVLDKIGEYVTDVSSVRGLAFCVSQAHAAYMATQFNRAGLPSLNLDANSNPNDREAARQRLAQGQLRFLFVVDLFNEGVDIPQIDLLLFLRPTESLTVFLQQLGRGLRTHVGKECLTVLDFVGRANTNYSFADKFAAILNTRRYAMPREIKEGFPHLPIGCSIHMERVAKEHILQNVTAAVSKANTIQRWITQVQEFEEVSGLSLTLQHFIDFYNLDIAVFYYRITWHQLLVRAGLRQDLPTERPEVFRKACEKLLFVHDPLRLGYLQDIIDGNTDADIDPKLGLMIAALFEDPRNNKPDPVALKNWLSSTPAYVFELRQLLPILRARADSTMKVSPVDAIPLLKLHAQYTRAEILFAAGHWTAENMPSMREGVLHLKALNCDLFFITLIKNEKDYSPTTLYADHAISPNLFHWQTQSTTSAHSPTAQRYFQHEQRGHSILLFVRETSKTETKVTAPFSFLGKGVYQSHDGNRPVNIVWKLTHPMPAHLYKETAMEFG